MVKWLQETPKTTTIRVNFRHVSVATVKAHILKTITDLEYLPICPNIDVFQPIPEIIFIQNVDGNLISQHENKEVIVDVPCGVSVLRGAHVYAIGVLAMEPNTNVGDIVNIFADIEGRCKKGTKKYESLHKKFIGIGQVKMQRYQLFGIDIFPKGIAIEMHETISSVPSIGCEFLKDQLGLLQNFPSIVCGRVLDPKANENVLDMCASPGNKTTHLAQLMNDSGRIVALDKSKNRVSILKQNVQRLKLECVESYHFDATKAYSETADNSWTPPFSEGMFDKILLDAPCSGSGNRPILTVNAISAKSVLSASKVQKKLLDVAIKLLKIGGILVYSTCSIFEAENELNVAWMLGKYSNKIELVSANPLFGGPAFLISGLSLEQCQKIQRYGPNFKQNNAQAQFIDSTGFFICKFRKLSNI